MSLPLLVGVCALLLGIKDSRSELRFTDPIVFDFYRGYRLNVTNSTKTQSTKAKNMMGCLSNCVEVDWCKSVNLNTKPGEDGLRVCELLSSDRFTKINDLTKDETHDHLHVKTPCEVLNGKPCYNGGECTLKDSNYACKCYGKYSGELCNIDGIWESWGGWVQCPCPQRRTRVCRNPLTNGAASDCPGSNQETKPCTYLSAFTINGCNSPLGMRDGSIPDSRISASSYYTSMSSCRPKHGRLHDSSPWAAWCAKWNDKDYLQIDLGAVKHITKVATQGRDGRGQWVTKYSLSYSNDTKSWIDYSGIGMMCSSRKQELSGNSDEGSVVENSIVVPFKARHIRIFPLLYHSWMSMRTELYGC